MGKWSSGNYSTVDSSMRIELSYLFKNGYIVKGGARRGMINWTDGRKISFESAYSNDGAYLRIWYTLTNSMNEKTDYNYKIKLAELPSNLGRGSLVYFVCPVSGVYCRKLYMTYGSEVFKARTAYRYRIYYQRQLDSKLFKGFGSTKSYEEVIGKLTIKRNYNTYKGQKTKRAKKIEQLYAEWERFENYIEILLNGS
jgi:hypothetical protein